MANPHAPHTDEYWMHEALELAEMGRGHVAPNPMVGCVIVSDEGVRIGDGYHKKYGEAHAEVNAVNAITKPDLLKNATVYVTLEPCSHFGKTPPCARMLAQLPIKRVVIGHKDPNKKVDGKGISIIREKGIDVKVGVLQKECEALNEFFIHHQTFGRPFITLKMAQTLDGFLAAADGDSKWISGKQSRTLVHKWRTEYDAVLVGRSTALLDNPTLTVRHVSGRQPRRVVLDGPYELPRELNVFSDRFEEKTIRVTWNRKASATDADPMLKLMQTNYFRGEIVQVEKVDGHLNLVQAFQELGNRGITSVLVEGGQQLASALIRQRLVDKLECFIAPKMLGAGTRSLINIGADRMSDIVNLRDVRWQKVGDDMLLTGYL